MSENAPIHIDPSQTSAFEAIRDFAPVVDSVDAPKAVVIGGGTGAPMSIRTLLSMGAETSVVVAMADDGGSTGILRQQVNVTPPGDIRKCLAALAADPEDPLTLAFKYRFEFADNHALGNLMLSALEYATGSFPEAIRICERILNVKGQVHPSTLNKITLCGRTTQGRYLEGQSCISHSRCAMDTVWLDDPPAQPYPGAIKAICEADLIVFGPGSLFTSIIPNLLVPGILDAIRASKAKKVFVAPLVDIQGETWGMSVEDCVYALFRHGMEGCIDYVLAHSPVQLKPGRPAYEPVYKDDDDCVRIRPVRIDYDSAIRIREHGPVVLVRNLADPNRPSWHNPLALRQSFTEVLGYCPLPQM